MNFNELNNIYTYHEEKVHNNYFPEHHHYNISSPLYSFASQNAQSNLYYSNNEYFNQHTPQIHNLLSHQSQSSDTYSYPNNFTSPNLRFFPPNYGNFLTSLSPVKVEIQTLDQPIMTESLEYYDLTYSQSIYDEIHQQLPGTIIKSENIQITTPVQSFSPQSVESGISSSNSIDIHVESLVPDQIKITKKRIKKSKTKLEEENQELADELNMFLKLKSKHQIIRCELCDKTFHGGCYYTQHVNTHHLTEKPFKCGKCGKKFSSDIEQKAHYARHFSSKPFHCDQCSKTFVHKSDLKRHQLVHASSKPHQCSLCGRGFSRNDHMRKHEISCKRKGAKRRQKTE